MSTIGGAGSVPQPLPASGDGEVDATGGGEAGGQDGVSGGRFGALMNRGGGDGSGAVRTPGPAFGVLGHMLPGRGHAPHVRGFHPHGGATLPKPPTSDPVAVVIHTLAQGGPTRPVALPQPAVVTAPVVQGGPTTGPVASSQPTAAATVAPHSHVLSSLPGAPPAAFVAPPPASAGTGAAGVPLAAPALPAGTAGWSTGGPTLVSATGVGDAAIESGLHAGASDATHAHGQALPRGGAALPGALPGLPRGLGGFPGLGLGAGAGLPGASGGLSGHQAGLPGGGLLPGAAGFFPPRPGMPAGGATTGATAEALATGAALDVPEGAGPLLAPPGESDGPAHAPRGWAGASGAASETRAPGSSPAAAALLAALKGGLADDPAAAAHALLAAGPEAAGEALAALALEGPIDRMLAAELLGSLPAEAQSALIDHMEAALPPESRADVLGAMGVIDEPDAAGGGAGATGSTEASTGAGDPTTGEAVTGATAEAGEAGETAPADTADEAAAEASPEGEAATGGAPKGGVATAEAGSTEGAEGADGADGDGAISLEGEEAAALAAGAAAGKALGKGALAAGEKAAKDAGAAEAGAKGAPERDGAGKAGMGGAGGRGASGLGSEAERLAGGRGAAGASGAFAATGAQAAARAEGRALTGEALEVRQVLQQALHARMGGGGGDVGGAALGAALGGLARLLKGGPEDACAVVDDVFAPKAAYVLHAHERRTGENAGDGKNEEADELIDAMRSLDFAGLKAVALDRAATRVAGLREALDAAGDEEAEALREDLSRARTQATLLLASDPIGIARFARESPETFPRTAARNVMGELLRSDGAAVEEALAAVMGLLVRGTAAGGGAHKAFAAGLWIGAGAKAAARIAEDEAISRGVAVAEAPGRLLARSVAAGRSLATTLGESPGGAADRDEALRTLDQEKAALGGALGAAAMEGSGSDVRRLGPILKAALSEHMAALDPDVEHDLEGELLAGFKAAGA